MKVIIYEGLFGRILGSQMTRAFKKACPGAPCETRSWGDKKPIPDGSILIGHSFGGYWAWHKFRHRKHAYLITVDLRWWTKNRDFSRVMSDKHFHFYQTRPLRGYKMLANSHRQLNLGNYGHMKAPSHPLVIEKIREVMGEN